MRTLDDRWPAPGVSGHPNRDPNGDPNGDMDTERYQGLGRGSYQSSNRQTARGMDQKIDLESNQEMEQDPGGGAPQQAPAPAPDQRDLTLGMTALVGIFLAVVLVCAVFFGFGYSTGRVLHGTKPAQAVNAPANQASSHAEQPVASSVENDPAATRTPSLKAVQPPSKPSAGAPLLENPVAPLGSPTAAITQPRRALNASPGLPPQTHHLPAAASRPSLTLAATPVTQPPPASPVLTGSFMVQIAAVMRPADADTLARALRTNGYSAVVRTEPQDKFLHVQVGPFTSRDQAKAMRNRLQGDGYNAFLKP